MDGEENWLSRFSNLMDQNIRGVRYGVYTISGLALLVAFRTVRPFIKFVKPTDIPRHFIAKKESFIGKVQKIEYNSSAVKSPLICVDHYPILPLPWKRVNKGLPIELAAVQVTVNGFSWMQNVLTGKEISFTPLKVEPDKVISAIYCERKNIGCQLVRIGLASVSQMDSTLETDLFYLKYYKSLVKEEERAKINQVGIWANSKVSLKQKLSYKLIQAVLRLIPFRKQE